jgi:uncharacterized protein
MTDLDAGAGPDASFWAWLDEGRVRFQRCTGCAQPVHRPRLVCPNCGGSDLHWEDASGLGTVHSVTTVLRPPRAFRDEGGYQLAMVDLDDGPRVLGRVVGQDVAIGDPVAFVADRGPAGPRLAFARRTS